MIVSQPYGHVHRVKRQAYTSLEEDLDKTPQAKKSTQRLRTRKLTQPARWLGSKRSPRTYFSEEITVVKQPDRGEVRVPTKVDHISPKTFSRISHMVDYDHAQKSTQCMLEDLLWEGNQ